MENDNDKTNHATDVSFYITLIMSGLVFIYVFFLR